MGRAVAPAGTVPGELDASVSIDELVAVNVGAYRDFRAQLPLPIATGRPRASEPMPYGMARSDVVVRRSGVRGFRLS